MLEEDEDSNTKTAYVMEIYYEEHKILKTLHPPNFSYLNINKIFWDYEQNRVEKYSIYNRSEKDIKKKKNYIVKKKN